MTTEFELIADLVEQVREAVADPRYTELKDMWTRHNRLEKVARVPVSVHLHGGYPVVWQELIPVVRLVCTELLARAIELLTHLELDVTLQWISRNPGILGDQLIPRNGICVRAPPALQANVNRCLGNLFKSVVPSPHRLAGRLSRIGLRLEDALGQVQQMSGSFFSLRCTRHHASDTSPARNVGGDFTPAPPGSSAPVPCVNNPEF
jgi:hypothetical protein